MMGQTHLAGGVALAITAEAVSHRLCRPTPTGKMGFTLLESVIAVDMASGLNVAAAIGLAAIASLLPDLDHTKSKASNLNFITRMISAVVRAVTTLSTRHSLAAHLLTFYRYRLSHLAFTCDLVLHWLR